MPERVVETNEIPYSIIGQHDQLPDLLTPTSLRSAVSPALLLNKALKGCRSADTEYISNDASLPGNIEIAVGSNVGLTISAGSSIALL